MIRRFKRSFAALLLVGLLALLTAAGLVGAAGLTSGAPASLRFDPPVSGPAAYAARQYAAGQEGEVFWPTFWREGQSKLATALAEVSADCIAYSGDAALVWPAEYLSGAAPSVTDSTGCAVSSALARRLWGSTDVVGQCLEADGEERLVRGVFESRRELILLGFADEDASQAWSAAELSGGPRHASRAQAAAFAAEAGLGQPGSILMSSGPAAAAWVLAVLPLILLSLYGLARAMAWLRPRSRWGWRALWFSLALGLALTLPLLLETLPPRMIPSRWSDLDFWAGLWRQGEAALRELLSARPTLRDVEQRLQWVRQAALGTASLGLACLWIGAAHTRSHTGEDTEAL